MTDYKTDYSRDKNENTLHRGSFNDFGDGTPARQVLSKPSNDEICLIDTSNEFYIYIGSALPGSTTSASVWRIQRVDLTTSEIKILFADSDQNFDNIWDNRASLSYG